MVTRAKTLIEKEVDRLFAEIDPNDRGWATVNPVTGGKFVWDVDPIVDQKEAAVVALRAREWFSVNGPSDAPLLPLSHDEVEDYRKARGLAGIVGFFARSLARQNYDWQKHPTFDDFACGLTAMAVESGLRGLEQDAELIRRFPPRSLAGMTPGAYWAPPKEYEETMASYRRAHARSAA
jgi:hypothetical protein